MSPQRIASNPAKWRFQPYEPGAVEGLLIHKNSMILRMAQGVADHFPVRVGEWIMGAGMIGWGWALWVQPNTFDRSVSLTQMSLLADESTWSAVMVLAGFIRLVALLINGTFRDRFKYSAHLRGLAAFLACFIWGQITLGILISYFTSNGILTGFVAYGVFMALDCWNLFRAWADVGHYGVNPG